MKTLGLSFALLGAASLVAAACSSSSSSSSNGNGNEDGGASSGSASSSGASSSGGASSSSSGGLDDGGGTSSGGEGGVVVPPGAVTFTIDMAKGPARQFQPPAGPTKVSDYVYGINGFGSYVAMGTKWGLIRKGGDSFTSWNWANDYGNSGADYCFWQGVEGNGSPAGALLSGGDSLPNAQAKGEAFLATIPILEHVSAAVVNNTGINNLCPQTASNCNGGTTSSVAVNSGNLDFVSTDPSSAAFVANTAAKGSALCTCPGPACGTGCTVATTGPVYGDELASYLAVNYGGAGKPPVFFMLDNEPNYWGSTHPELWPYTGTLPCETATVTYDDVVTRDKAFATAIKAAVPSSTVFGPVVAQDGMLYAHSYADAHIATEFADYYLQQMAAAGAAAGKALLDVFDVHYYNSGSTDPAQCMQSPRMFWDPGYTSLSAADTDKVDFGWAGLNDDFDTKWYPRQVAPRLLGKIAAAYTGTSAALAPKLSFSEYNSGCETVIAGGVAEADDLGILGREGVFAATAWPLQGSSTTSYLVAAFAAYRNYDGNGSVVGDTAVSALTSDVAGASVYAFAHSGQAGALDLVLVNKATASTTASIVIHDAPALSKVTAYNLVDGAAAVVPAKGAAPTVACGGGECALGYTMPATSVTTLVLR